MTDYPFKRKEEAFGVNIEGDDKVIVPISKKKWCEVADYKRIKVLQEAKALFSGHHCGSDGGPFRHPYQQKLDIDDSEYIPYQVLNLLGKSSEKFADLIIGAKLKIESSNETNQEILDRFDFERIWDALTRSSYQGYVGFQAFRDDTKENDADKIWWEIIDAENLTLTFGDGDEIKEITKSIYFEIEEFVGEKKKTREYVYQETHTKGYYSLHLYEVKGTDIKQELDVSKMEEFKGFRIEKTEGKTEDGDFGIKILINKKIGSEISSDYSLPAVRTQEALNARETSIARILDVHSDPRLMAPRSAAKKDPKTGQYKWDIQGREVIFVDEKTGDLYSYLTWDAQLEEARNHRDHCIMKLCTELDMAPQLLDFFHLLSSGPAETSAKLTQLLASTKAKALRKRKFLNKALWSMVKNLLMFAGSNKPEEFSIVYPDIIPSIRAEVISEMVARKQNTMLDPLEPWMKLDGLTKKDAQEKYNEAVIAASNEIKSPFGGPDFGEGPPPLDEEGE